MHTYIYYRQSVAASGRIHCFQKSHSIYIQRENTMNCQKTEYMKTNYTAEKNPMNIHTGPGLFFSRSLYIEADD